LADDERADENIFRITQQVEMGRMASLFFNKCKLRPRKENISQHRKCGIQIFNQSMSLSSDASMVTSVMDNSEVRILNLTQQIGDSAWTAEIHQ
jgi:hypothetical protein